MKDIAVLMASWKTPELLRTSVLSVKLSLTTNSELIVILNEVDSESVEILEEYNVTYLEVEKNFGPSAVDFAIPYIKRNNFKYVANINSDMLFSKGWDAIAIRLLEERKPCSVSASIVGPAYLEGSHINVDDLGSFFDLDIIERFNENVRNKKYIAKNWKDCNHPIITTTKDFLAVGGYSDNLDPDWIKVKGRFLDPHFGFRLHNLYNGKFLFLQTNEIFIYHEAFYTRLKFASEVLPAGNVADSVWRKKTGIHLGEFLRREKFTLPIEL